MVDKDERPGRKAGGDLESATARARPIQMILMDVDGTLTDGTISVLPDGEEVKAYHVWDGLGILLARMAGLRFGIITGKTSKSVERRAKKLRIEEVRQGVLDKKKALDDILGKYGLTAGQVAYIGDDLGDLEVLRSVGLGGAVADAHPEIKNSCQYICRTSGGRGAVREFIEFILAAQGKWDDIKTRSHEIRVVDI
jgi:3-deoxy-D-manno-octulosonate 8-phosphate phosphatase (KDO 8-P phosphatase)